MTESLLRLAPTLTDDDVERILAGCSHALVPDAPAARGYRYLDLGGECPPFYLRRISAGPVMGAVTLTAPIELSSGDEAEPGAPGLAGVGVTIDVTAVPWPDMLRHGARPGVWGDLARQALAEVATLDLLTPAECPICAADR
jgi:hypothetical protein